MPLKVYTYPRFGDHIVCFGLIKDLSKSFDVIHYYTDPISEQALNNYKRLYSSIKNVVIIEDPIVMISDHESSVKMDKHITFSPEWYEKMSPWLKDPSLPYHCNLPKPEWFTDDMILDKHWYAFQGCPFYLKWDNFYFERNIEKEKEVYYDILKLNDKDPFIFIQDDPERDYLINKNLINKNYRWVEFYKFPEISILDTLYTIEKAKEIHTFNTGLSIFIDQMSITHPDLNYHKYCRDPFWDMPSFRLNWKIIA